MRCTVTSGDTHISEQVGKNWEKPVLLEGWTRITRGSGGENDVCGLLLWTMSSTLSMTKCQCNGALSVGSFFHWGVPRSTSGVRLTAFHYNAPSLASAASLSFPLIYLPAVCYLLISQVSCNDISSPHTYMEGQNCQKKEMLRKLKKIQGSIISSFFNFLNF